MPLPAIIAGGAQVLGSAVNAFSTGKQNKKSRQFSREMYNRQYNDNISFWHQQNEYNSPQAQMQRLQAAGLNPNLVYGSGSGAAGQAGSISTPDVQSAQFRTPEWGNGISTAGLTYMNAMYDFDIKQAQIDNLKADNTVKLNDALLKQAQARQTGASTDRSIFDLDFLKELRDVSADTKRELLRQKKTQTDVLLSRNEREAAMNSSNLREAGERILNMRLSRAKTRQEIKNIKITASSLRKSNVLKDLDINLRKQGINPNDPMWTRVLGQVLSRFFRDDGTIKAKTSQGNTLSRMLYGMFGN